jgi:two-component system, LytTR family, response regulator
MRIRTLIVDDEPLAREWVRNGLQEEPDVEIIGECGDGFEAVQAINEKKPQLVLLDVQMPGLDGFGVLASLEGPELPAVIFDRSSSRELKAALHALLDDIQRERAYPEWLLIKREDRSVFLKVADIDWIESSRNNVRLHVGKEVYVYHETTSGIEGKLDPKKFFRIHRSTIVNIEKIREMHPWFNGDYAVTLKDGTKLTLSSTYRERLKEFRRLAV